MTYYLADVSVVEMRQDFLVRGAAKGMAARFEIGAQLSIVVNFAVEDDRDAVVFVEGRLLAGKQVDYRQPPHAERDSIVDEIAFRIRPAMNHAVTHRTQQFLFAIRRRRACVQVSPSSDSAHNKS